MSDKIATQALRLRVYIGETSHYRHKPLYHAIVLAAREMGLAGATVMRALEGFGAGSRIHTTNILDLSGDLPVVVEIVDGKEYIEKFLPVLEPMVDSGMITVDDVIVYKYAQNKTATQRDTP